MRTERSPARSRVARGAELGGLLALVLAVAWYWLATGDLPQPSVVLVRPVDMPTFEVMTEEDSSVVDPVRVPVDTSSVISGRVTVRRPDGVGEGVAAWLTWLVTQGDLPSRDELGAAPRVVLPADGSFVIDLEESGTVYCVAEHEDGVASYARSEAKGAFLAVTLAPAGKIRLSLPGNGEAFTLLLSPGGTSDGSDGEPAATKRRMQIPGSCELLHVGGIPLSWGTAHVSVLFHDGARVDHRDAVPLVFRQWSDVTMNRLAAAGSVHGFVENEQGDAVPNARIHVYSLQTVDSAEYVDVQSDIQGGFRVDKLKAGRYAMHISATGYVGTSDQFTLALGESRDLGIRVLGRGATVRGRVLAADVSAVTVSLAPAERKSDHTITLAHKCDPDPAGEFRFENVAVGAWTVAVHAKEPQVWTTAWSGCRAIVRDGDVEVVVPDIRAADWSTQSIRLDAPTITSMADWKAVAVGAEGTWCTYGRVDAQRTVQLQVGPGPFLFGLAIPQGTPGLVWCGVLDGSVHECRVPTGQVTFDCSRAASKRGYLVTVIYRGGAGWPAGAVPLASETMLVNLSSDEWSLYHLPAGAFEARITFAGEVRNVPFVTDGASVIQLAWPY